MQVTTDIPPSTAAALPLIADIFLFIVLVGLFTYVLHRQGQSQKNLDTSSMKPSLTVLIISLLLIVLFAPSNLNIYLELGGILYIIGMSWQIIGLSFGSLLFSFIIFLVFVPFMFLRLVFVYQVYKYYLGIASRKRVVTVGILAELQFALISLAIIVIAALNLILDFDFIERGSAMGAPKYMEWYGAFGLMVTLVWLYIEFLRLLTRIAGRN